MSILSQVACASLAVTLCVATASAQSFNLDIGDPTSAAGSPAPTYGAAAASPGVWNALGNALLYTGPLVDLAGAATSAMVSSSGGGGDIFFDNVNTIDPDDVALLEDLKCGATTWTSWAGR